MSKFDATLRKVFYNASTGFGSIAKTYKAAKALDDNVTLAATRDFLKRQELRQKAKPRTDNSYVAPGPRDTVQFDLADLNGSGLRLGTYTHSSESTSSQSSPLLDP